MLQVTVQAHMFLSLDKGDSSTEEKILGLDRTIFIVIVVAVVTLILLIIMAICLRKPRRRTDGVPKLIKYLPSIFTGHRNRGRNATESENPEEGQMDLDEIRNEKVCTKEEIKLT